MRDTGGTLYLGAGPKRGLEAKGRPPEISWDLSQSHLDLLPMWDTGCTAAAAATSHMCKGKECIHDTPIHY